MSPQEIRESLNLGEGPSLEFKSSLRAREAIGKIICGFLNGTGGYIICGVSDSEKIIGSNETDASITKFEDFIHASIRPGALVDVQRQELEGKQVIIIEVPKGSDPPYAFEHIHYIRVEERLAVMDASEIREIVLRAQIEPERWERRFSTADMGEDLELAEIEKAVRDVESAKRAFLRDSANPAVVLQDFDVSKYGRLTHAGDVLFTKRPSARHPQVRIRAMRYNSDKAGSKFDDMKSFEGPLRTLFEDAYNFIVRNTPTRSVFREGKVQRMDTPCFPESAVREALVNALVHRDYASPAGGVAIHIYPNRLEIWNSGALPEGVSDESLHQGQISVLRNPDIAHVLYLRGYMEKAGRGSVLILQECERCGLPEPQWESDPNVGVTLTLFSAPNETPPKTPPKTLPKTPPKTLPKTSKKTVDKVLNALEADPSLTLTEVSLKVGKSLSAIKRAVAQLTREGNLRYVGPSKGGHWEILKQ